MNRSALDLHFKMDTGEELTFVPSGVRPLTFADLAISAAPDKFEMEFSAPKATLNGEERVGAATARATVQFHDATFTAELFPRLDGDTARLLSAMKE